MVPSLYSRLVISLFFCIKTTLEVIYRYSVVGIKPQNNVGEEHNKVSTINPITSGFPTIQHYGV